jgi:hypothetical protein
MENAALGGLAELANAAYPFETGGILLGWWADDALHIVRGVEVLDPQATNTSYNRKHETAASALAAALHAEPRDSLLGYVGEWHCHPTACPPSTQDRRELQALGRATRDPLVMAVMLCSTSSEEGPDRSDGKHRWMPSVWVVCNRRAVLAELVVVASEQ